MSCSGVQSGWETRKEVWGGDDDTRAKCLLGSPSQSVEFSADPIVMRG